MQNYLIYINNYEQECKNKISSAYVKLVYANLINF